MSIDASEPAGARLDALFAAQVQATPRQIAVQFGEALLSYKQLDHLVDGFASDLLASGVGPGVLVALCVARTPVMIAMILAILKAGGAYLPLDHRYPAERLAFLLHDSAASVLVTDWSSPGWMGFGGSVLRPARDRLETLRRGPAPTPSGPSELAYVIYTSGSTGAPKGVMLGHGATRLVAWARTFYAPEERACIAATTSLCFDPSVFEIFVPLCTGGTVLLKEDALEPYGPAERPTMIDTAPSVLRELCRGGAIPQSARVVNVGGEALTRALADEVHRLRPDVALYNHYGPTEATTCATVARIVPGVADDPPIGRPVRGATVSLVSATGAPCASGEVGEIHIGGDALALGYLNRPDLTAERFPNGPNGRVYRTGDLGLERDGDLYFAGRVDRQVKIRGFRVEPAEIEAALLTHEGVEAALVVPRQAPAGLQLVAYVQSRARPTSQVLRRGLASSLPTYMVPAHLIVLDALPRAVSGKIDLAALPEPAATPDAGEGAVGLAERPVLHVFEEVLGLEDIGPDESFFDLGGDSLASVRAALRLEEIMGREIPAALLHQAPTARLLAASLARLHSPKTAHLSLLEQGAEDAPLFCVADLFGEPFNYLSLARALGPQRSVYGLAPGPLEAAFARDGDVERLTAAFAAEVRAVQPQGPYLVAGYSAGGLLAACLSDALARDGAEVRLVLLDAALHGRRPSAKRFLNWAWRWGTQRIPGSSAPGRAHGPRLALASIPREKRAFAWRMIRLNLSYKPRPFGGPTLLLLAAERDPLDRLFDTDGLSGWSSVLTGDIVRATVPGGHRQIMRTPNVIATAEAVEAFLGSA